jgi:hypothetical protein
MKKMAIMLSIAAFILSGCSGMRLVALQRESVNIPKTFYDRTITYRVDADAKKYMTDLENLLGRVRRLSAPYSDDLVLPIYRDTDIDRNRRITEAEAIAYYNDCILKFEDSLGPVQFQYMTTLTAMEDK